MIKQFNIINKLEEITSINYSLNAERNDKSAQLAKSKIKTYARLLEKFKQDHFQL